MGLRRACAGLAAGGPAPVFAVVGAAAGRVDRDLRLDRRVRMVDTPRSANIMLVLGEMTADFLRPAVRVHDMMSHPRATIWAPMGAPSMRLAKLFPGVLLVSPEEDLAQEIVRVHRSLLMDERDSDEGVLPDEDPTPWRGIGPYGQGGKGMTGGVPYGRPMAVRAPDRDGLQLDKLDVRVGPFFAPFPPGLTLDVRLQGDVIQSASVRPRSGSVRSRVGHDVFHRALLEPTPIATLELARARHHLYWLSDMLRVHGLGSLGLRTLRLTHNLSPRSTPTIRRLGRLIDGTRSLSGATAGVGILPEDVARDATGPVARAAGHMEDARAHDKRYLASGFVPIIQREGDARARWRQRVAETVQALEIAGRAGPRRTESTDLVESPRGALSAAGSSEETLLTALPTLLMGREWGDAVTTIVSLDLDLGVGG